MQEKKELKVGDWVRVKRNLAVHAIGRSISEKFIESIK